MGIVNLIGKILFFYYWGNFAAQIFINDDIFGNLIMSRYSRWVYVLHEKYDFPAPQGKKI